MSRYLINIAAFGLITITQVSCISSRPVTAQQWQTCTEKCRNDGGLKEACDERFRGKGCHCGNDKIIWLKK